MGRRLILDTGVLIASERVRVAVGDAVDVDDDVVIAAVTVAELRAGVELADDAHRERRRAFVEQVLQTLPVEPYDMRTATAHATLLARVRRAGRTCGAHDLVIAATAVTTARTVLTTDRHAGFGDLPGVESITIG